MTVCSKFSYVFDEVKEPRHRAPAPSLMTCQFSRVRTAADGKKVTLERPSIILTLCGEIELRLIVFDSTLLIIPLSYVE